MMGPIQQEISKARLISLIIVTWFVRFLKYTARLRRINPFAAGVYAGGFLVLSDCQRVSWTIGYGGAVAMLYIVKVLYFSVFHRG